MITETMSCFCACMNVNKCLRYLGKMKTSDRDGSDFSFSGSENYYESYTVHMNYQGQVANKTGQLLKWLVVSPFKTCMTKLFEFVWLWGEAEQVDCIKMKYRLGSVSPEYMVKIQNIDFCSTITQQSLTFMVISQISCLAAKACNLSRLLNSL